jgi:hypothetical protein
MYGPPALERDVAIRKWNLRDSLLARLGPDTH